MESHTAEPAVEEVVEVSPKPLRRPLVDLPRPKKQVKTRKLGQKNPRKNLKRNLKKSPKKNLLRNQRARFRIQKRKKILLSNSPRTLGMTGHLKQLKDSKN